MRADDPKEQIAENLFNRSQEFKSRRGSQIKTVEFPTTTIGSFPQTAGERRPALYNHIDDRFHKVCQRTADHQGWSN